MRQTFTAIFDSPERVKLAVEQLHSAGFRKDDISVLMSEHTLQEHFADDDGTTAQHLAEGRAAEEGATISLGTIAFGVAVVGAVALTGVGLFAGGPLLMALGATGAAAAGAGLAGALVGYGVAHEEAEAYEAEIKDGAILIGITTDDDNAEQAHDILVNAGGRRIAKAREN